MLLFWCFCSIFASLLFSAFNAGKIQNAADNVIANARKIFNPAAADNHNGMFLQVMAFTRNICGNFLAVGQANSGNFPQSRVRFFRSGGKNLDANAALKWRRGKNRFVCQGIEIVLQSRRFGFALFWFARFFYQLMNRRHTL